MNFTVVQIEKAHGVADNCPPPWQDLEDKLELDFLKMCLCKLSKNQATVLSMVYGLGEMPPIPISEVYRHCGFPHRTALRYLREGISFIKQFYNKKFYINSPTGIANFKIQLKELQKSRKSFYAENLYTTRAFRFYRSGYKKEVGLFAMIKFYSGTGERWIASAPGKHWSRVVDFIIAGVGGRLVMRHLAINLNVLEGKLVYRIYSPSRESFAVDLRFAPHTAYLFAMQLKQFLISEGLFVVECGVKKES